MNWLTNFVRPKLRALVQRRDVPDNLWHTCRQCEEMIFHRDLEANLHVCQHCGHHMRVGAPDRLKMMFDDPPPTAVTDPPSVIVSVPGPPKSVQMPHTSSCVPAPSTIRLAGPPDPE